MRSPVPGEVMDLTNMLNQKGAAHVKQFSAAAFMDHQQLAQYSIIKPEHNMERSASPHGSEHSHYSTAQHMGRSYGSPTVMQAPMHLTSNPMPNHMQMSNFPDVTAMSNMDHMNMHQMPHPVQTHTMQQSQHPLHLQPPVKAYPCGTCGKGFARRSDLARHGE